LSKIVEIASKEIGTKESPMDSNLTKYGAWFGLNGMPWCAIFVSWCYAMAGNRLPKIGFTKGFAGCQTAIKYFKDNNRITKNPIAGDLVFFDFNNDNRYDHVGIFDSWNDEKSFYTIEGNTSLKNQSNGGEVMRRIRYKNRKYKVLFVNPIQNEL
jgi:CHAP domain